MQFNRSAEWLVCQRQLRLVLATCPSRAADAFRAPFVLGDAETLLALCRVAGIAEATVTHHDWE